MTKFKATMILPWTIDLVKSELPNVDVLIGKNRYQARVCGRLNPFATLAVDTDDHKADYSVAWPTLVRVLNAGGAVRV